MLALHRRPGVEQEDAGREQKFGSTFATDLPTSLLRVHAVLPPYRPRLYVRKKMKSVTARSTPSTVGQ